MNRSVFIYFVISILSYISIAVFSTLMGIEYLDHDIGRGLHPAIAFPLASLCIFMLGIVSKQLFDEVTDPAIDAYQVAKPLDWPEIAR